MINFCADTKNKTVKIYLITTMGYNVKEVKRFFDNDFLNKGYIKNVMKSRKSSNYPLPPLDVIEQYEEYYPGFTKQYMLNMQKNKEQEHAIQIQNLKSQPYRNSIYKKLEILFISILVHIVIFLFIHNKILESLIVTLCVIVLFLIYLFSVSWKQLTNKKKVFNPHPARPTKHFVKDKRR